MCFECFVKTSFPKWRVFQSDALRLKRGVPCFSLLCLASPSSVVVWASFFSFPLSSSLLSSSFLSEDEADADERVSTSALSEEEEENGARGRRGEEKEADGNEESEREDE